MIDICIFAFITFLVACFNDCFDRWIAPGQIFQAWGYFLVRNEAKWWSKVLGLCIYCTNVWAEVIAFGVYVIVTKEWHNIWMIPAGAVVGNVWLARVLK